MTPYPSANVLIPFRESLMSVLGMRFSKLIVFGSFARGEARPDSDVDLLLVLRETVSGRSDVEDLLVPMLARYLLETGLLLSVVVKTENEFSSQKEGLMWNIAQEGIEI
jgi:predicted nucleotidyltransferase